eukprot:357591-Chlamydomonas_euryale.AAC.6
MRVRVALQGVWECGDSTGMQVCGRCGTQSGSLPPKLLLCTAPSCCSALLQAAAVATSRDRSGLRSNQGGLLIAAGVATSQSCS